MNILHVSTALSWRGGEQQLAYLVEELRQMGIKQTVCCVKDSAMERHCTKFSIPFIAKKRIGALDIRFAFAIAHSVRRDNFSIVHTHDAHAHTFAAIAAKLFSMSAPIVVSRRVDFPISSNWFSRWKYNHSSVRKILCVSKAIQAMVASGIENPERAVTVYSGVDIAKFHTVENTKVLHREYGIPDDVDIVGNVAALAPHKDYKTFVDTAGCVCESGKRVKFFIIGAGAEHDEIVAYIREKELSDHIILTGFRNDIPTILPELDVFLITSETEGLGTSILDAFACGVPVVATAAGGIPEIVDHETNGLLAPIKEPDTLAAHVQRLLVDNDLRMRITHAATETLQKYTKSKTASATRAIYESIMDSKS